jgi:divalent metal cation (Fe/Co/Zn/Cd) transporter
LVGLQILWSGWKLLQSSANGMMDAAPSKEEVDKILQIIKSNYEGAIEVHDLRVRHAGRAIFIDFDMVVPSLMTVKDSHAICDKIEQALKTTLEEVRISIHVEPEFKAKNQL